MLHRTTQSAGPSCCELSYSEAAASGVAGRSSEHHHQALKNRGETGGITGKCEEQRGKSDVEKQRGNGPCSSPVLPLFQSLFQPSVAPVPAPCIPCSSLCSSPCSSPLFRSQIVPCSSPMPPVPAPCSHYLFCSPLTQLPLLS
ncbi:hypothetical protein Pcinc_044020 [Petrolisthes cinctipes]|uniref:Uncharacterized protein n=1 Tax=Petrolisthes cinctipes TaxID=88211 RepID=A0AAE1BEU7_PETCI|nr:hypothetical protein Pcinc_044020 [Petrolisthes cinctipes]